ncbi:hypothetical protein CLV35_2751 [Motilibacter peucedani]|uniref:Uncharacterized protein n=1 Tax=Motilibacter peucedani TaxID=598650 RepID=A0A420XMK0_9ACTN|nr:hypothetical protein [Motilibacter peucedani]RKS72506.1 hypothetical protein CLV35_2751 [Motilibacter peucedani]
MSTPTSGSDDLAGGAAGGPAEVPTEVPDADAQEQARTVAGDELAPGTAAAGASPAAGTAATVEADEGDLVEQARDVPLGDRDDYP